MKVPPHLVLEHRPALVLLDLHLPDISGEDVLQELKARPETTAIPVVVMSADATEGRQARLVDAGAADYLSKPIDVGALLAIIDRWCVSAP